jgi:hypothetical protein
LQNVLVNDLLRWLQIVFSFPNEQVLFDDTHRKKDLQLKTVTIATVFKVHYLTSCDYNFFWDFIVAAIIEREHYVCE